MRSDKIVVHVSRLPGGVTPKHDYCKLSFRSSIRKLGNENYPNERMLSLKCAGQV